MGKINIIEKKIDELTPYANNPRNNTGAVDAVAASLQEFGWKQPVVIDKAGVIIAGHTRIKAAEKLGLETAPCIIADDLTEEQVRAYRLADNKTAELAGWDFDLLSEELTEITGLDMSGFGFDDGSVEEEKYSTQEEQTDATETPESRAIIAAVSVFGEKQELFVVRKIDDELAERILEKLSDETAEKIGGVLKKSSRRRPDETIRHKRPRP